MLILEGMVKSVFSCNPQEKRSKIVESYLELVDIDHGNGLALIPTPASHQCNSSRDNKNAGNYFEL